MSNSPDSSTEFMTMKIGGQLFGLAINRVQDVFSPDKITKVPLSDHDISGVLNLRGRIVTVIDMRRRLELPDRKSDHGCMAVGIESGNESFGLLIDSVGEVLHLKDENLESNPANLDACWTLVSGGVHRLEGELLVVLDVDRVLAISKESLAA